MKKYTYQGQWYGSKWMKRSNFVYLFFSWNAFGIAAYFWWSGKKSDDEEWNKLSGSQKYLRMMSYPDTKVTVVNVQGLDFAGRQKVDTTMEEVTSPK